MAREIEYGLNSAGNFRLLNFATGSYKCTCRVCSNGFIGDKRAVMCLVCAIKAAEEKFAAPNPGSPKLPPEIIESSEPLAQEKHEEKTS